MKLSTWAKQNNISYKAAWKRFNNNKLPVPAHRLPNGTIIVDLPEEVNTPTTKQCVSCKSTKSITMFYRDKARKDGFYHSCKDCERVRKRPQNARYTKERNKTDLNFKIRRTLRIRINKFIKGNNKIGSAVADLGCSLEQFIQHIEQQFQPGMTWDNHSTYGWHFDHIIPLSSFDLTDREQFLQACHYTNYQPLWAIDNLKKGSKIILW